MAALTERKIAIVRTLVESAPDRVVGRPAGKRWPTPRDDIVLAGVRRLVEAEAADRRLRNADPAAHRADVRRRRRRSAAA